MSTANYTTKIAWTAIWAVDGTLVPGWTFNPWEGCAKISPGCRKCYASTQHDFYYAALNKPGQPGTCWGLNAPRLKRAEPYWREPLRWNRLAAAAQAAGLEKNRRRVFCMSMGDIFEVQGPLSKAFAGTAKGLVPTGNGRMREVEFVDIDQVRVRLLRLIYDTQALDWLLLTKRPENIMPALQAAFATLPAELAHHRDRTERGWYHWLRLWASGVQAPANVWLGTSVENQQEAERRIPHLLAACANVRFLSLEPLLEPVQLNGSERCPCGGDKGGIGTDSRGNEVEAPSCEDCGGTGLRGHRWLDSGDLDWLIVGGESGEGPLIRPLEPAWVASLVEQGRRASVPVFVKQMGSRWAKAHGSSDKAATALDDLPAGLRVRQSPDSVAAAEPALSYG